MQDPEFERQVREEMNELRFSPSESVWTRVVKDLNKDKQRGRPFFWYLLLIGIGLAAGGYLILTQEGKRIHEAGIIRNAENKTVERPNSDLPVQSADKNEKAVSVQKENSEPGAGKSMLQAMHGTKKDIATDDGLGSNEKKSAQTEIGKPNHNDESVATVGSVVAPGIVDKGNHQNTTIQQNPPVPIEKKKPDPLDSISIQMASGSPEHIENAKPWKLGFASSLGLSDVFLKSLNVISPPTALSSSGYSSGAQYNPSPVHSGFSFLAGINIEKEISKQFNLSIGLNYHYYSTSIETSQKIDSTITINNPPAPISYYGGTGTPAYAPLSLFASSAPPTTSFVLIPVGHSNHYHFLEMPILAFLTLNPKSKTPIQLEAGLTPSQLLSADALVFHYNSGLYYKDNSAINKTQLSGNLGFLLGFGRNQTLFRVGPEVQYFFTRLVNQSTGGYEHLFYAGIKLQAVLKKK